VRNYAWKHRSDHLRAEILLAKTEELELALTQNHKREVDKLKFHVKQLHQQLEESNTRLEMDQNAHVEERKCLEEVVIGNQRQYDKKRDDAQRYKEEAGLLRPRVVTLGGSLSQSQIESKRSHKSWLKPDPRTQLLWRNTATFSKDLRSRKPRSQPYGKEK